MKNHRHLRKLILHAEVVAVLRPIAAAGLMTVRGGGETPLTPKCDKPPGGL